MTPESAHSYGSARLCCARMTTKSWIVAGASIVVKFFPDVLSQIRSACVSAERTCVCSPWRPLYMATLTMGSDVMWSFTSSGAFMRTSYKATCPVLLPAAKSRPLRSVQRARMDEPASTPPTPSTVSVPAGFSCRGSNASTVPFSQPASTRPCPRKSSTALTPSSDAVLNDSMKRPWSRLMRKISWPVPPESSSAAYGLYSMQRCVCGTRRRSMMLPLLCTVIMRPSPRSANLRKSGESDTPPRIGMSALKLNLRDISLTSKHFSRGG
mmetsp:Transcript_37627/g.116235  ORF Transcript_37627/g.116235 Transcript_37627/m.116235 type:complete len:268 (-) Transcript_37627:310-1113(-)